MVPDVLRTNRNYRRSFLADLASNLGSGISTIAFPLLVLGIDGSAVRAGTLATVSMATRLVFRLPAGYLVDRWPPRVVMVAADLVRCAALGSIPLAAATGHLLFLHLVGVAVVEGLATALFGPAVTSLTRDIVSQEQLPEALGLGQAVQAVTILVGPAVGGALFAVDRVLPFSCDAASYLVSATLLWGISARPPARAVQGAGGGGVTAGIRWLLRERVLFTILLYASVINLVSAAIDVMVVVSLRAHGEPGNRIGLIVSCFGVGAVVGSLLAPRLVKALSVRDILLGMGTGWTAVLLVFSLTYSVWLTAGLLTVLMTLSPAAGVAVGAALFGRTPRALVGRVSASASILLMGLSALGPLAAGTTFQGFGASRGWFCMAVVTAAVTAVAWLPLQAARHLSAAAPRAADPPENPAGPGDAAAPGPGAGTGTTAGTGKTTTGTAPGPGPGAAREPEVVAHRDEREVER